MHCFYFLTNDILSQFARIVHPFLSYRHITYCTIVSSLLVSNIFTMSQEAIFNMKGWFLARGLPWSESLSEQLNDYCVERVEDLKLFSKEQFVDLFAAQKFIVREKSRLVYGSLMEEKFCFARCAKGIPLDTQESIKPMDGYQQVAGFRAVVIVVRLAVRDSR